MSQNRLLNLLGENGIPVLKGVDSLRIQGLFRANLRDEGPKFMRSFAIPILASNESFYSHLIEFSEFYRDALGFGDDFLRDPSKSIGINSYISGLLTYNWIESLLLKENPVTNSSGMPIFPSQDEENFTRDFNKDLQRLGYKPTSLKRGLTIRTGVNNPHVPDLFAELTKRYVRQVSSHSPDEIREEFRTENVVTDFGLYTYKMVEELIKIRKAAA